jgi:hypothetical protein
LSGYAFAAKHGKTASGAHYTHRVLFGKRHHTPNWWKAPDVRAIFRGGKSDTEIAAVLRVSPSSVRRLRRMLRRDGFGEDAALPPRVKPEAMVGRARSPSCIVVRGELREDVRVVRSQHGNARQDHPPI